MKKAVIIYASTHHGNTAKVVRAIALQCHTDLIDATKETEADLSRYDLIGFASGIDFGRFYPPVVEFLIRNLPENKQVFFLYTCARVNPAFTRSIKAEALKKGAVIAGEYGCRGYNTYGPWKLVGGMNKKHPTADEIEGAVTLFKSIQKTTLCSGH